MLLIDPDNRQLRRLGLVSYDTGVVFRIGEQFLDQLLQLLGLKWLRKPRGNRIFVWKVIIREPST